MQARRKLPAKLQCALGFLVHDKEREHNNGIRMNMAYSFVLKAAAKTIPEARISLKEFLRIATIPMKSESKLKNKHTPSIRKVLERIMCHGLKAKSAAAKKPVVWL